jgi:hypothetical protein
MPLLKVMPFIMIHGGNMKEALWGMAFGSIVTLIVLSAIQDLSENSERNIIRKAVYNCEKSLPRDQHCYIIAVPPSKD